MSILSLNYRGLGNPRALQFLIDTIIRKKPNYVFLCKMVSRQDVLERVCIYLKFECELLVNSYGRSGGIALLWRNKEDVELLTYARNYINVKISCSEGVVWRL